MEFYRIANNIKAQPSDVYRGFITGEHLSLYFKNKYMFDREVNGIKLLEGKPYAPVVTGIDENSLLVVYKYQDNLNHMLFNGTAPDNYRSIVREIKADLESSDLYRINFFQHPFVFVDGKFCLIDNYGMGSLDEKVHKDDVYHFLNDPSRFIFNGDYLDIQASYNLSIERNIGEWPDNFLND